MSRAEKEMLKKTLRLSATLMPEVKVLFPHQRMRVSFADEPHKEVEMSLIVNLAQELYKVFNDIDPEEEAHISFAFANRMVSTCLFDYPDDVIYKLLCRDAKNGYK